ncbi:phosphoadenosine phosphosulfate reductase [Roseateles sp. YR242]|uniref:phosphoadenylyl-sulfate reductase n=1 Tax=Roseateles sp. YR242 TaxID=1855305 RepID=UPI0008C141DF|nr:phosphoadenylyl-sulfate reductase [Roseateles sp. YR242]SEK53578.1 phosphoadenosine phosphosulfate reductase [Roseateles sp. YR242]
MSDASALPTSLASTLTAPAGPAQANGGAIGLYARATPGFEDRLARTVEVLRQVAADFGPAAVQSTSLGVEDMIITDLIARHHLPIALSTLDTGKLHEETLGLIPAIEQRYGLKVEVFSPVQEQVLHFVRSHGDDAMYRSIELRKACCGVRKLEPLARMLAGKQAWITGLRREQSNNRADVPFREPDGQGRTKVNPLAEWSWADVWHYVQQHVVPYNPLHDHFMPSIGCAPCTRAISVGEDFRAGRWWWESDDAKECGLHKSHGAAEPSAASSSLPRTGAPA